MASTTITNRRTYLPITSTVNLQLPMTTRQIMTATQLQQPDTYVTERDIYNLRAKVNQDFLKGRTPIQALLIELLTDGK
ncbi:hypothetical protein N7481_000529 [Penicillium waksmanii]|uniref:uncharacterized protein n=1 Tax=Penicillium waksmanii TaxID=69791 RepID=UPI002546EFA9|nr:uncharacterized protein N7481_000529 [Penicillium waksmanii]KAJ6000120.1 hypothetical protein N7481_000529 [Penicillium waksmanii]